MGNRDELWKASWESLYDASYYEILFGEVSKSWQFFDFITRLLVALTASGSAVAGWVLWNDEQFKVAWVIAAGVASVLSILHTTFNTPERINSYSKLANEVSGIRLDYETFHHELKVYPEFDIDNKFQMHKELREKFRKALDIYSPDFMTTDRIRHRSQTLLNVKLGIEEHK